VAGREAACTEIVSASPESTNRRANDVLVINCRLTEDDGVRGRGGRR